MADYQDAPYAMLTICKQLQSRVMSMNGGAPGLKLQAMPSTQKKSQNRKRKRKENKGHEDEANEEDSGGGGGDGLNSTFTLQCGTLDLRHEGLDSTVWGAVRRRDGFKAVAKVFTSREAGKHELQMLSLVSGEEGTRHYIVPVLDVFNLTDMLTLTFPRYPQPLHVIYISPDRRSTPTGWIISAWVRRKNSAVPSPNCSTR
jgi:hypothetical protein